MTMEFEWDEAKSDWTRRERGFGFEEAALIFEGSVQTTHLTTGGTMEKSAL